MKSIKRMYKIGVGPSSSHTMGPVYATNIFLKENPKADNYKVILYGSLAKTGKGHGTDTAVKKVFEDAGKTVEIVFNMEDIELPHENTMDFFAYKDGKEVKTMRVLSVGGGDIEIVGREKKEEESVYKENTFGEILDYCVEHNMRLSDFVIEREGEEIINYLQDVWNRMQKTIYKGLSTVGTLPGGLNLERKANYLYNQRHIDESETTRQDRIVCAYAYATSEQNAAGGVMVTGPTCGSCGVIPAVFKYAQETRGYSDMEIIRALCTAGIVGNIVKRNASISGAECGCQAEIGTACAMAAAGLGELYGMGLDQIEYAAEISLEHHLGLTCDPICGLVQIPCIERNAIAAMRAMNNVVLASFLTHTRKISFDLIVETMYETGKDMHSHYKETSIGGLAKLYKPID